MAFHEEVFPISLSVGTMGGPFRKTEIATLASGGEARNARHANSRRKYDARSGVRCLNDLATLIDFWEARVARLYGFRILDPLDHKSCPPEQSISAVDQVLGTGTGAAANFQAIKVYGDSSNSWTRTIRKLVSSDPQFLRVSYNGVEVFSPTFTVNLNTGVISGSPGLGVIVRAGFWFHTPARFDTDDLSNITMDSIENGEVPSIPIIEDPIVE